MLSTRSPVPGSIPTALLQGQSVRVSSDMFELNSAMNETDTSILFSTLTTVISLLFGVIGLRRRTLVQPVSRIARAHLVSAGRY